MELTDYEIKMAINTLKNNKAPDENDLTVKLFQNGGEINSKVWKLVREV